MSTYTGRILCSGCPALLGRTAKDEHIPAIELATAKHRATHEPPAEILREESEATA